MNNYSLYDRACLYYKAFPDWPAPRADDRWIDGMWILGQDYKGSGYYGAYPPNYLKRVMSMFPDANRIVHLFAGSLPPGDYTRVDLNPDLKPDLCCNAETLHLHLKDKVDLILADPPYSNEDAEHYGIPMCNRNKVIDSCSQVIEPGGFLIWLDQVLPMFRKDEFLLCGAIGIVRSTNHRFRVSSWFKKL